MKGEGFSTLVTTLMQVPYGAIIALSILSCVYLNDYMSRRGAQTRCWFILLYLSPNIAGAFGLAFLPSSNQAGRLVSYYLTGPYNAAFCLILSLSTANTAGHTKKVVTNAVLFLGYWYVIPPLPPYLSARRSVVLTLLPPAPETSPVHSSTRLVKPRGTNWGSGA